VKISVSGFTSYKEKTEIALPSQGVVLVMGENGSGKSSIIEAVAYAQFGKTVRGTSPWQADLPGEVSLELGNVRILRTHTAAGKNSLTFRAGESQVEYETTAKAQDALSSIVGDFDVWRRSSVFSSHDAAHFTLATDSERKRFLEATIGLTVFDGALEACRKELNGALLQQRDSSLKVTQIGERLRGTRVRLDDALKVLSEAPPQIDIPALETKKAKLEALLIDAEREIKAARAPIEAARATEVRLDTQIAQVERDLSGTRAGVCPTCGAKIPAKGGLQAQLEDKLANLRKELAAIQKRAENPGEVPGLEAERAELVQKRANIIAQLSSAVDVSRRRELAEAAVAQAKRQVEEESSNLTVLVEQEQEAAKQVKLLSVVESVLGTRGVRTQILSKSLASMEAVANLWLGKIAGEGLRLRLKPFTEKKSGGVADAISLDVEGAGGGFGYRASSGGERRRLDIAITLALSEIAAGARGKLPGIIFLDELLDCLDAEGTAAALSAVRLLGETRCVVLISHSEEVLAQLTPDLRLKVSDGRIERC
jgi:DNA repair exonuclease SbcCD ATPase subunit